MDCRRCAPLRLRAAALLLSRADFAPGAGPGPARSASASAARRCGANCASVPQGVSVPAEITKRGDRLILQTADAAVPVVNPGALGLNLRQLPVQVVVSDTPAGVEGVRIGAVKLQATERWQRLSPQQRSRFGNVDAAQRRLGTAADSALRPNATPADPNCTWTSPTNPNSTAGSAASISAAPKRVANCRY